MKLKYKRFEHDRTLCEQQKRKRRCNSIIIRVTFLVTITTNRFAILTFWLFIHYIIYIYIKYIHIERRTTCYYILLLLFYIHRTVCHASKINTIFYYRYYRYYYYFSPGYRRRKTSVWSEMTAGEILCTTLR